MLPLRSHRTNRLILQVALASLLAGSILTLALSLVRLPQSWETPMGNDVSLGCFTLGANDPRASLYPVGVHHFRFVAGLDAATNVDLWWLRLDNNVYAVRSQR
jgi:hypothetical protein